MMSYMLEQKAPAGVNCSKDGGSKEGSLSSDPDTSMRVAPVITL